MSYSKVIFQMDINENTSKMIESNIRYGTKVYFFTYDPVDSIENTAFMQKAKDAQMLELFETKFNSEFTADFSYNDAEISLAALNKLEDNTLTFNKEQYVIEHADPDQNISVLAGAGTGKTTVMVNRVLYLKHKNPNLSFSEIAMVTFTNKAALNLRERIIRKLKFYFELTRDLKYLQWVQELKNMVIGTIHSLAETILTNNRKQLSEHRETRISQFRYTRRKIIEETIDDFNLSHSDTFRHFKYIEHYRVIQTVEKIIDQIGNHSISTEKVMEMDFGEADDHSHILYDYIVKETLKRLEEHKQEKEAMDVNDLIVSLDKLADKRGGYTVPYRYLLIDEFQDSDHTQTRFFASLTKYFPLNLFVVGDVKQSIYRFRGADYTAFKQLAEQADIHQTFHLRKNYRSDKNLLEELNEVFAVWPEHIRTFQFNDRDRLQSHIEYTVEPDRKFITKRFPTKANLINFLTEMKNTDTAVLVRTNKEVNDLSFLCEENQIFHISEQDGNFFRSIPVREFYQLIRRFTHPSDYKNRYALHISSYGEKSLNVKRMLRNFSPDRTFREWIEKKDEAYRHYEAKFKHEPPFEVFRDIIITNNPSAVYANRFVSDSIGGKKEEQLSVLKKEYQMNLDHLLYLLKRELQNTIPTLSKIERLLNLKMATDKTESPVFYGDPELKRLKIMTIHKAKGLEFDQVFLPYTEKAFTSGFHTNVIIDGRKIGYKAYIKKDKSYENNYYQLLKKEERMENAGEEARLLYVALTRARKKVYVAAPEHTNAHSVRNWGDLIATGIFKGSKQALFSD